MIKHIALVMDGNRRWAKKQGLLPWLGHQQGAEAIETVIKFCIDNAIAYVSLYAFSIENLKNRPSQEKQYLFNEILVNQAHSRLKMFQSYKVRIRFLGDTTLFPESVRETIAFLERETATGDALQLNLLFCYGARQEIIGGVKQLLRKIQAGSIALEDISEQDLDACLWTAGIPEPELIIRTGGAKRLSNFLLYQAAYSELYFLDCLWPEITQDHMQQALAAYQQTQRNFGV